MKPVTYDKLLISIRVFTIGCIPFFFKLRHVFFIPPCINCMVLCPVCKVTIKSGYLITLSRKYPISGNAKSIRRISRSGSYLGRNMYCYIVRIIGLIYIKVSIVFQCTGYSDFLSTEVPLGPLPVFINVPGSQFIAA